MAIKNIIATGILLSASLAHAELPDTVTAGKHALSSQVGNFKCSGKRKVCRLAKEVNQYSKAVNKQLQNIDEQLSYTAKKHDVSLGILKIGYTHFDDEDNRTLANNFSIFNDGYYSFNVDNIVHTYNADAVTVKERRFIRNTIYFKGENCTGDAYYKVLESPTALVAFNNPKKGIFFHKTIDENGDGALAIYFHDKEPEFLSTSGFSSASSSNGEECSNSSSTNKKGVYIKLTPFAEHNGVLDDLPWIHDSGLYSAIKYGVLEIDGERPRYKLTTQWDGNN